MNQIEIVIFFQFFIGLFAAVNPVGIMPVFVSLTAHLPSDERNKIASTATIAVAIILVISLLAGQFLLDAFSISLDSFRVAGGLLLMSIAFSMMSGKLGEDKQNKQEQSESVSREQIGVVPLAMLYWQARVQSALPSCIHPVIQAPWILSALSQPSVRLLRNLAVVPCRTGNC